MSLDGIALRKLLLLFGATSKKQTAVIRDIIRRDIRPKEPKDENGGGHFHLAFWADAKNHTKGTVDLGRASADRIRAHKGRERLYPLLTAGFLSWWALELRSSNEVPVPTETTPKGHLSTDSIREIAVENFLGLKFRHSADRIVYPYFSEAPILRRPEARLGLWAISQAIPDTPPENIRILDVLRSRAFSFRTTELTGSEEAEFEARCEALVARYNELRKEYP